MARTTIAAYNLRNLSRTNLLGFFKEFVKLETYIGNECKEIQEWFDDIPKYLEEYTKAMAIYTERQEKAIQLNLNEISAIYRSLNFTLKGAEGSTDPAVAKAASAVLSLMAKYGAFNAQTSNQKKIGYFEHFKSSVDKLGKTVLKSIFGDDRYAKFCQMLEDITEQRKANNDTLSKVDRGHVERISLQLITAYVDLKTITDKIILKKGEAYVGADFIKNWNQVIAKSKVKAAAKKTEE